MPKWTDVLVTVCLGLFIVGGLIFLYMGLKNVWAALASKRWPSAVGVVKSSGTETSRSRDSETGETSTMYAARLRVAYEVGGREYETGTVWIGETEASGDSSEAELKRLQYPEGAVVPVYFDPKQPERSALRRGLAADALWLPGAGLGLFLAGSMFLQLYFAMTRGGGGMQIGITMFGAIFALCGAAMLAAGLRNLWLGHESRNWPRADGEIVYSVGDSTTSVTEDEDGTRSRSTTYSTRLVYRYEAGGFKRHGNVWRFGQLSGASQEWAESIASKYPKGEKVKVAYDPSDPDLCVLEPGIDTDAYWIPGIGLVALLFGLAAIISLGPVIDKDPAGAAELERFRSEFERLKR